MGTRFYQASKALVGPVIRGAFRIHATGVEHVPRTGGAILASNHLSFMDHFCLPSVVPRQIYFLSKAEHFEMSPIRNFLWREWGAIPVKRGQGDGDAFARAYDVLVKGECLGIYPEGTRSPDGRLYRGKTGVARLALTTRVPVVPVGMIGTDKILPKGEKVPRFDRCTIKIGPALRFDRLHELSNDRDVLRKVTDEIMVGIRDLTGQEYVDSYCDPKKVPLKGAA
ncbi:MAG: lysophospholipid acyltransferase family protein [Methanobacteriota archaeon]